MEHQPATTSAPSGYMDGQGRRTVRAALLGNILPPRKMKQYPTNCGPGEYSHGHIGVDGVSLPGERDTVFSATSFSSGP
jgi:hypothetical protein